MTSDSSATLISAGRSTGPANFIGSRRGVGRSDAPLLCRLRPPRRCLVLWDRAMYLFRKPYLSVA